MHSPPSRYRDEDPGCKVPAEIQSDVVLGVSAESHFHPLHHAVDRDGTLAGFCSIGDSRDGSGEHCLCCSTAVHAALREPLHNANSHVHREEMSSRRSALSFRSHHSNLGILIPAVFCTLRHIFI
ncbi:uncharacterized protein LOC132263997 [Phlebotomus argentipes]|uniref:uncharacterized protein LOC132263997 n=1 Tax=Phlebotomus argentipes TaxID=94469 RepID=UPI0028929EC4|nr:uncharacterized protein LOC132263997 [Phlebotomus argentipes]